ncbi:MAG TPA: hypothetical protein VGD79_10070, partial [Thermoanaerobaculia bacterium]
MDPVGLLILEVEASGYKRSKIAADAGMATTKLSKILNRKQIPNILEYCAIRRVVRPDLDRIFRGESGIDADRLRTMVIESQQIRDLSQRLSEALRTLLPEEAERGVIAFAKPEPDRLATPVHAAANPNAELLVELEEERKEIPRRAWNRGARRIALVNGDSMDGGADPIADGELAYLKPTRSPRTANNHITLVRWGEAMYLK